MGWSWLRPKADWHSMSSQQLLARYVEKREPAVLSVLFDRYGDALYRYLLRSSEPALAADISQQAWLRVMELGEQFAGHSQFKTWLFSIARNLLVDEYRKLQRHEWLDDTESLCSEQPAIEQQLIARKQDEAISLAIQALPALQREALLLQLEGFSVADIARICRVGDETAKSRLRYARDTLKQQLGEWHDQANG